MTHFILGEWSLTRSSLSLSLSRLFQEFGIFILNRRQDILRTHEEMACEILHFYISSTDSVP